MGNLQSQITSFELEAKARCHSAQRRLVTEKPASWFLPILEDNILPSLSQIGIDRRLGKALFQIGCRSWQRMGPSVNNCLWIHPSLTRSILEIRNGLLIEAEKREKAKFEFNILDRQQRYEYISRSMSPANLSSQLDDIFPSWIILPRAFSLLKENDGCCLISYLKYTGREKNSDFRKLIIRIVIEFLANYSLKFAGASQCSKAVAEVIFYGYAAMFWKNLQQPPEGCEELAIYKNFLHWMKTYKKRAETLSNTMQRTLDDMVGMEEVLFPAGYLNTLPDHKKMEYDKISILFRHGTRGLEGVCRYFDVGEPNLVPTEFPPRSKVKALTLLIQDIKDWYETETGKTQESTLLFLKHLKASLRAPLPQHQPIGSNTSSKQMDFMNRRLWYVIDDFIQQQPQSSAVLTTRR